MWQVLLTVPASMTQTGSSISYSVGDGRHGFASRFQRTRLAIQTNEKVGKIEELMMARFGKMPKEALACWFSLGSKDNHTTVSLCCGEKHKSPPVVYFDSSHRIYSVCLVNSQTMFHYENHFAFCAARSSTAAEPARFLPIGAWEKMSTADQI